MPLWAKKALHDRIIILHVTERTLEEAEPLTTIIFILELVALAVLIICGALLLLDAGSKKKQPEHKPEPQQPQRITKHPGRSKRRPKGQTGRKHPKGKRED